MMSRLELAKQQRRMEELRRRHDAREKYLQDIQAKDEARQQQRQEQWWVKRDVIKQREAASGERKENDEKNQVDNDATEAVASNRSNRHVISNNKDRSPETDMSSLTVAQSPACRQRKPSTSTVRRNTTPLKRPTGLWVDSDSDDESVDLVKEYENMRAKKNKAKEEQRKERQNDISNSPQNGNDEQEPWYKELIKSGKRLEEQKPSEEAKRARLAPDDDIEETTLENDAKPMQQEEKPLHEQVVAPVIHHSEVESLWSDSDNEVGQASEVTRKRKRGTEASTPPTAKRTSKSEKKAKLSTTMASPSLLLDTIDEGLGGDDDDQNDEMEQKALHLMPNFANPKFGPFDTRPLVLKYSDGEHIVPASITRYLKPYQKEGVAFMHARVVGDGGAILGDDMGLGKTVQVIAMLAALLEKKGSGLDKVELVRRRKAIQKRLDENLKLQQEAMRQGTVAKTYVPTEGIDLPAWAPILIAVPPSVMENWMNELNTWGHFGAVKFAGPSRDLALERIREGLDEIMVCGSSLFKGSEDDLRQVKSIPWKLLIVDEYHQYKNFKTKSYEGLKGLKETCGAQLVGLTGTLMQNNHEELWSLVDLIHPGFLGTLEDFKADTSVPIKLGRTKTADEDTIETSNQIREWLSESLKIFYLQRLKSIELKNELPEKDERVLFCELSPLQKRLYKHLLSLPDFQLLLYANAPCECGVNQAIFQNFKLMRTEAEKIAFQRDHRGEIIPRKSCCYERPLNPNRFEAGEEFYDPRAVLWRWQHEALVNGDADEECDTCPFCCSFPVLDKLYKLSSHVSLLQVQKNPDTLQEGTKAWREARKALDFAKVAFPFDCLDELPGGSYFREDGIMNNHANLSGKMKVLAELLHEFDKRDDRILLFSFSTQTLDLIQNFVMAQGYSYLRLDGTTPTKARQGLVDRFQRDKSIFLFLISTKAGGLGLNLTEANIVIVFDVDFNPSNDEQSQDRAYRIGQKRDVLVIRLVSRGTVEELKYIRQIYKVQLKKDTIGSLQGGGEKNHEAARLFRAVAGDKERKGELFGMENLLKFKDGSFMEDLWKSTRTSRDKTLKGLERFSLQAKTDLADQLDTLPEDAVNHDGGDLLNAQFRQAASNYHKVQQAEGSTVVDLLNRDNAMSHEDFLRSDRGDAARKPGDEGFDEEMGGASQAAFHCLANAPGPDDEFD